MTRDMRPYIQDILESIEAIDEYFGVSLKRIWRVIKIDLVDLKFKISRIWEEIRDF